MEEIICSLFFIQILTRKDWSWYLKWLYIWNEERNEVEEFLLDIHKIEVRTILTREWIISNLGKLMQEYFLEKIFVSLVIFIPIFSFMVFLVFFSI